MDTFERIHQGKINGFIMQGFNPLAALPNKKKVGSAMAKLKYLVVIDPLRTETGEFWKNYGELNNVKPEEIQTEVIRLPASCFAEDPGTFTNSGRVIQWHWAGRAGGRSQVRPRDHRRLFTAARRLRQGRRQVPRPDPEADLGLCQSGASVGRGAAARDQRPGAEGRHRPEGPDQGPRCLPASSCRASPCCATMARPPAATGSTAASGRRPATCRHGVTRGSRAAWATT
jgi:hypothetical protein